MMQTAGAIVPDDIAPYWTDGRRYILHGDCREILPRLRGIAAVVTDPPYLIHVKSDGTGKINPWADCCNAAIFYAWWLAECRRSLPPNGCVWTCLNWRALTTYQKAACDISWPIESLLVWDKGVMGTGGCRGLRSSYELVALFAGPEFAIENRGLADIVRVKWRPRRRHHPAEKPVALMQWLIQTLPNDGPVLDPFCGSGTTLVAAAQLDRIAIGIEIDERHCETAARRLEQRSLFTFGAEEGR